MAGFTQCWINNKVTVVLSIFVLLKWTCGQETLEAQWGEGTGPCRDGDCLKDTLPWTRTAEYVELRSLIADLQNIHQYCESQSWRIDILSTNNEHLVSRVQYLEEQIAEIETNIDSVQRECEKPSAESSSPLQELELMLKDVIFTDSETEATLKDALLSKLANVARILRMQKKQRRHETHKIKLLDNEVRMQKKISEDIIKTHRRDVTILKAKISASSSDMHRLTTEVKRLKSTTEVMSKAIDLLLKDNLELKKRCSTCEKQLPGG